MIEITGLSRTWEIFSALHEKDICDRGQLLYDPATDRFTAKCFGSKFYISKTVQQITSDSSVGRFILGLQHFFDLSLLWYVIGTQNIALSGDFIKPADIAGGQIFVKGTHVLPLDKIALQYNNQSNQFKERGLHFGADLKTLGDASICFYPFPRIPVTFVLWYGDDDFPPSAQLLLDATCSKHLAPDVVWAVTTICCHILSEKII